MRAHSSSGQSRRLITGRFLVRVQVGPPCKYPAQAGFLQNPAQRRVFYYPCWCGLPEVLGVNVGYPTTGKENEILLQRGDDISLSLPVEPEGYSSSAEEMWGWCGREFARSIAG